MNSIPPASTDSKIRLATFDWLTKQTKIYGEVLPRDLLAKGFEFEGERVPLVSPQGIFKPKVLSEIPLSITTSPESLYDDRPEDSGLFQYHYRRGSPDHRDNVGLREAMKRNVPLVYFIGVAKNKYLAVWPAYIVGDNREGRFFTVSIDDSITLLKHTSATATDEVPWGVSSDQVRAYITREVRQRVHQRGFRERVLQAYRERCAFCKLRHLELLDAAHIIPDSKPEGIPDITNGIALCKLHHAAFDSLFIGIRPDYIIEVRKDILKEEDGPMLLHGLKKLNKQKIILPSPAKLSPNPVFLAQRYEEFRAAI